MNMFLFLVNSTCFLVIVSSRNLLFSAGSSPSTDTYFPMQV